MPVEGIEPTLELPRTGLSLFRKNDIFVVLSFKA
jgi:hypothetical protein